ncbi:MAG: DegQ family serine endoprotease [Desulfobacterales bacterium]
MNMIKNMRKKPVLKFNRFMIPIVVGFFIMTNFIYLPDVEAKKEVGPIVPSSFSDLAARVSSAVVNIRTVKTIKGGGRVFRQFRPNPHRKDDPFRDFFEKFFGERDQREFKQRSLGSGFFIDKKGFIVTNNHVIENADKIKVKLNNGKEFDAKIVGRDPNTDLALIKIESPNGLPVIELGDSNALKVGEWVVAIGSPFGLEHTVTAGIVSAKGRVIGSGPYDDFIQTDASINPGNSGGPLIDMSGKVVGINTAIIASGQGIGFAVPINMAKLVIEQLKESGEVSRGWLGVGIQPLSDEMAEYYGIKDRKGALVVEAFPDDPAYKAGIRSKDIIIELNGMTIENSRDLTRKIAAIPVGSTAEVKVLREGKTKTFKVVIGKRDDKKIFAEGYRKEQESELGIRVSKITPEMAQRFGLKEAEGVLVLDVEEQSKGSKAGVLIGDVIKEINHQPVSTAEEFSSTIANIKKGDAFNLFIWRRNAGFLVVKITK